MRSTWKYTLATLSLAMLMSAGVALAQEPAPPPTDAPVPPPNAGQHQGGWGQHRGAWGQRPNLQLTADQQARMKALHQQFEAKRKADRGTFESEFKSILTHDQLALVQQRETARKQREAAFKKGEDEARQKLQQSGQPVPKAAPDGGADLHPGMGFGGGWGHGGQGWGAGGGERPMMAFGGPGGGPGGPGPGGKGHRHHRGGNFAALKLTPEQQGEVHVFQQSMMEKRRSEMQDMRKQMEAILTPEQQQQLQQEHGLRDHMHARPPAPAAPPPPGR